jgi:dihydrofolate synthase/folylpolyglutamate synthase
MSAWEQLHRRTSGSRPGREVRRARFQKLLAAWVRESGPLPRVVKITGTAGKGSVCAQLEAMLLRDGQSVCTFTSPHLFQVVERIRIGGVPIPETLLESAARECLPFFDRIEAQDFPSLFETLLILALHLCRRQNVDLAILEVAIGGSNDVVSLIPGPLAAITSIGLDHWEELGPELEDIARDKAGIASAGSTIVLGPGIPEGPRRVILESSQPQRVTVVPAPRESLTVMESNDRGTEIRFRNLSLRLPLAGDFQADNFAVAAGLFERLLALGWARDRLSLAGAEKAYWPGRLEYVPGTPPVLLDAAHNELAFEALRRHLDRTHASAGVNLVFGASEPAKLTRGIEILGPRMKRIAVATGFYRSVAATARELASIPSELRSKIQRFSRPRPAFEAMRGGPAGGDCDLVVVAGSIYLLGDCRALLEPFPQPSPPGTRP